MDRLCWHSLSKCKRWQCTNSTSGRLDTAEFVTGDFYAPRNSGQINILHTLNKSCFNSRAHKGANSMFGISGNSEK